jgi:hypothetical protein
LVAVVAVVETQLAEEVVVRLKLKLSLQIQKRGR